MVRSPVRPKIIPPPEVSKVLRQKGPNSLGALASGLILVPPGGSRQIRPGRSQFEISQIATGPFTSARSSAPSAAKAMPPKAIRSQGKGTR